MIASCIKDTEIRVILILLSNCYHHTSKYFQILLSSKTEQALLQQELKER